MLEKPNKLNISKVDNLLSEFKRTGNRERYCLEELCKYLNSTSKDYSYEISCTLSGVPIAYDAIMIIRYKMSGNIAAYYLLEAKVREGKYDTLILEKKKLNNLKKEKTRLDKYMRIQGSEHKVSIMYIQFFEEATYMFDILSIIDNNLLPKITKKVMNKVTVASTEDKVEKQIYLLPLYIAVKKQWKFNQNEYATHLLQSTQQNLKELEKITKQTYSIF